ncbi:MAG: hypothetical protein HZB10_01595 [Candidatus Yonathbacteria bacterium]|nr:hypothetical protein [Candidatus Yonathbacteria bacterium]
MSIPVYCTKCGAIIGVKHRFMLGFDLGSGDQSVTHGVCNHTEPQRTETLKLFDLIKQIRLDYPETETVSTWEEYVGPPIKFILWCAIVFGTRRYPNGTYNGVTVNGKWAWWDSQNGFYGDGVAELGNLQLKTP